MRTLVKIRSVGAVRRTVSLFPRKNIDQILCHYLIAARAAVFLFDSVQDLLSGAGLYLE